MPRPLPPTWRELLHLREGETLRQELSQFTGPQAADLIAAATADPEERAVLFRLLPTETSSTVFAYLDREQQRELLAQLSQSETAQLLEELAPDDTSELLDELPPEASRLLLEQMTPHSRERVGLLLAYPENSAGRFMTPDFVAVRPEWTVAEALEHLRSRKPTEDAMLVLYVVDEEWHLIDALDLRRFVAADPAVSVSSIMDSEFVAVQATDDQEQAVRLMMRHDLIALPVVDGEGVLVGSITYDDALDVQEEEFTKDAERLGGVQPLGKARSEKEGRFSQLYRARIGWLLALVFLNIPSGALLAHFEDTLAENPALLLFLPLLIASSGNAGTQASTLMVRALATGRVSGGDWLKLLRQEVLVAGALGLSMAVAASAVGLLRSGPEVAIIVGLTMVMVVLIGSLVGMSLPLVLEKLKVDPATSSAPLVTALADISGVLLYFVIAGLILDM